MTNKNNPYPTRVTVRDVAEVRVTFGGVTDIASVFIRLDSTGVYTVQGDSQFHTREYPVAVVRATVLAGRQIEEQSIYSVVKFS